MNERLRAVNRVEHPLESAPAGLLAKFFANDRVFWKPLANPFSQQFFRRAVCHRDWREVGLPLNRQVRPAEISKRTIARLPGNFHGKLQPFSYFRHMSRPCWCCGLRLNSPAL